MSVTAKFYVQNVIPSIEEQPDAVSRVVTLGAVCRGAANREWASATPAGSVTMTVRNDAAVAQLVKGEEYELTFRHVPKPTPGDGHEARPGPTSWNTVACETCGMNASWKDNDGAWVYVWDDEAQARHDEAYGIPTTDG